MPKMKTKSGAKKRFKFTANGHVKVAAGGQTPRHDQADDEVHPQGARHHGPLRQDERIVKNLHALQPLILTGVSQNGACQTRRDGPRQAQEGS